MSVMNGGSYSEQKLFQAVLHLASSDSDMATRVANVWPGLLQNPSHEDQWPSLETWRKYVALYDDSESIGAFEPGPKLSDKNARELATRIVGLFWSVTKQIHRPTSDQLESL